MPPFYLSSAQAAAYLGMSVAAFRMALHRGHLKPTGRIGSRLLFTRAHLDEQIRSPAETHPVAANDNTESIETTNAPNPRSRRETGRLKRQRRKPSSSSVSLRAAVEEVRSK